MIDVYYPKNQIPIDSRVVVYGAGKAGQAFIEQINCDAHCTIVRVVDKNYLMYKKCSYNVDDPRWLSANQDKYDVVLVAVFNWEIIYEIRDYIVAVLGLSEKKVISSGYQWIHPTTKTKIQIEKLDDLFEVISREDDIRFDDSMTMLGTYLKTHALMSVGFFCKIYELYYKSRYLKTKYLCAYILFLSDKESKDFLVDFTNVLAATPLEYVAWILKMGYDIVPYKLMRKPELEFDDYYIIMNALSKKIAQYIYALDNYPPFDCNNSIRIAFSFSELYGKNYHMTRWAARKTEWLISHGYEVCVFVEGRTYSRDDFFVGDQQSDAYEKYKNEVAEIFHEEVELKYAKGKDVIDKMNDHINNIIQYMPKCVFVFDVNSGCVSEGLDGIVPTILVPTTYQGTFNTANCIAFYDKKGYLSQNNRWMDRISNYPTVFETIPGLTPYAHTKSYRRSELGFCDEDFLIVTVGNRLPYEIKDEFVDAICELLRGEEVVKWVLVGTKCITYIDEKYRGFVNSNRIVYLEYIEELFSFYKICDLYVNPNRIGGGTSVLWAIQAEIPVLMCNYDSDGKCYIGEERTVQGDYSDLVNEIKKIVNSTVYYLTIKESFLIRKNELESVDSDFVFFESIKIAEKEFMNVKK